MMCDGHDRPPEGAQVVKPAHTKGCRRSSLLLDGPTVARGRRRLAPPKRFVSSVPDRRPVRTDPGQRDQSRTLNSLGSARKNGPGA